MWTQETPSQEGTYWVRRVKRHSPEQVTIKDDKVVFLSGNIKDLANVKGQWSGPIEPRKEPQEGKSESLKRVYNWLLAHAGKVVLSFLGTIFLGILIPFLLGYFSITSSKLVYVGEPPEGGVTKMPNSHYCLRFCHTLRTPLMDKAFLRIDSRTPYQWSRTIRFATRATEKLAYCCFLMLSYSF